MGMIGKRVVCFVMAVGFCGVLAGCESELAPEHVDRIADYARQSLPIVNGTRVTGNDHLATVAIELIAGGMMQGIQCTGTLITDNYVLTAGHCIMNCDEDSHNIEYRPYMYVGIGQAQDELVNVYQIEEFIPHPEFECANEMKHDIALLKLKRRVPASEAVPVPPLRPEDAITADEVDSKGGINLTSVGFGKTVALDDTSHGTKYEVTRPAYAVCPLTEKSSKACGSSEYLKKKGILYFDASKSATCTGDSGGPSFVERNGKTYVAAVTSYSYTNCSIVNGMTLVTDYYDFIAKNVPNLNAVVRENCTNKIDDNGDGKIDCLDPDCLDEVVCRPENCSNKVDDNGNGKIDCDDPECAGDVACLASQETVPEVCGDKIDNDGDNLIDCDDPDCMNDALCADPVKAVEICNDHIDNDGDGFVDCDDYDCLNDSACVVPVKAVEICNDHIDNDNDGATDCNDSDCANDASCVVPVKTPEICNDHIDNDGDGLIDCLDLECVGNLACVEENCTNGIDDNGDGRIDCLDPKCVSHLACQGEICDDGMDNNGDGKADCDDPLCDYVCVEKDDDGCSAVPRRVPGPMSGLLLMIGAGLAVMLRRKFRNHG